MSLDLADKIKTLINAELNYLTSSHIEQMKITASEIEIFLGLSLLGWEGPEYQVLRLIIDKNSQSWYLDSSERLYGHPVSICYNDSIYFLSKEGSFEPYVLSRFSDGQWSHVNIDIKDHVSDKWLLELDDQLILVTHEWRSDYTGAGRCKRCKKAREISGEKIIERPDNCECPSESERNHYMRQYGIDGDGLTIQRSVRFLENENGRSEYECAVWNGQVIFWKVSNNLPSGPSIDEEEIPDVLESKLRFATWKDDEPLEWTTRSESQNRLYSLTIDPTNGSHVLLQKNAHYTYFVPDFLMPEPELSIISTEQRTGLGGFTVGRMPMQKVSESPDAWFFIGFSDNIPHGVLVYESSVRTREIELPSHFGGPERNFVLNNNDLWIIALQKTEISLSRFDFTEFCRRSEVACTD